MRTFEYSGAGSHKFWNIEVTGTSFTTTFGKIGTAGKSQNKTFATDAEAQAEADKLIKQKTKKGYRETTKATSGPALLREAMEAAILENPDDPSSYMALADHLQEEGDPQGEFMQVQLALEDESLSAEQRKSLEKREKELLDAHRAEWAGEWIQHVEDEQFHDSGQLPFPDPKPVRFRRGLATDAVFEELTLRSAVAFHDSPQTRTIQRLYVSGIAYEEEDLGVEVQILRNLGIAEDVVDEISLHALVRWPYMKNLRVFQMGWTSDEDYTDFCSHRCHESGEFAYDFVKQMPDLEELYLFAHCSTEVGQIVRSKLPKLRVLQIYHAYEYPLDQLAKNASMTNLTHLLCHPHALEDEPAITLGDLRAILKSKHLTSLTHLRLRLATLGDQGAEEIAKSGILKRLKMLDLRHGCVGDKGARALAESPDLKNLELLDLSRNQLTEVGIDALRATGVTFDVSFQHEATDVDSDDDTWFYEAEWLFEGDYE